MTGGCFWAESACREQHLPLTTSGCSEDEMWDRREDSVNTVIPVSRCLFPLAGCSAVAMLSSVEGN
ncbi:hypothetical protein EYF80_046380 [Liparis tanakae]|uniref:Uncharacterized protein n=1 Tax=Liparis tanakae TaxID=230148 RepID=A0A4Z2FR46_9TELE|nr:hypothetical protein EYF80_046380 [Liparis tanakae]